MQNICLLVQKVQAHNLSQDFTQPCKHTQIPTSTRKWLKLNNELPCRHTPSGSESQVLYKLEYRLSILVENATNQTAITMAMFQELYTHPIDQTKEGTSLKYYL